MVYIILPFFTICDYNRHWSICKSSLVIMLSLFIQIQQEHGMAGQDMPIWKLVEKWS